MKNIIQSIVIACGVLSGGFVAEAQITTEIFGSGGFGIGGNAMYMNFVDVGNAGNAADTDTNSHRLGRGSVGYNYKMGQTEVSERQIASYNADAVNSMNLITLDSREPRSPATNVNWNEAARFVNWLNVSKGYQEAYKFTSTGGNTSISLWTVGDAGYDVANAFRNSQAHYVLASEDEWYKAAYHQGDGRYHNWATGPNAPTAVAGGYGYTSGIAVYDEQLAPAITEYAGTWSFYGTMAQSGNVWEWNENGSDGVNDLAVEDRKLRGGSRFSDSLGISASNSGSSSAFNENGNIGFRVAVVAGVVPEPSAWILSMIGGMTLLVRRRRG